MEGDYHCYRILDSEPFSKLDQLSCQLDANAQTFVKLSLEYKFLYEENTY